MEVDYNIQIILLEQGETRRVALLYISGDKLRITMAKCGRKQVCQKVNIV